MLFYDLYHKEHQMENDAQGSKSKKNREAVEDVFNTVQVQKSASAGLRYEEFIIIYGIIDDIPYRQENNAIACKPQQQPFSSRTLFHIVDDILDEHNYRHCEENDPAKK